MAAAPTDLLDALPDRATIATVRQRFEQLEAIEEWAKDQLPVGVGSCVVLSGLGLSQQETPGWWYYREALADGAKAVVIDVRFASHRACWVVDVELDQEWSVHDQFGKTVRYWNGPGDPPDGYDDGRRGKTDRRHTWALTLSCVQPVTS